MTKNNAAHQDTVRKTDDDNMRPEDSYYWNPDPTTWDESIFEWCREMGFNPFGSGPTPIFCTDKSNNKKKEEQ